MTELQNSDSPAGRRKSTPPHRHRAYVFAVTALATFMLALWLLREFSTTCVTTAKLIPMRTEADLAGQGSDKFATTKLANIEELLTAPETLQAALPTAEIDSLSLRRRLAIRPDRRAGNEGTVLVSLMGTNGPQTVVQLNSLVQTAVAKSMGSEAAKVENDPAATQARQAVIASRHEFEKARRERDAFTAKNRERMNQLAQETDQPAAAVQPKQPIRTERSAGEIAARERLDQLTRESQELHDKQRLLLVRMTPAHPHYQLLTAQVHEVELQVADARRAVAMAATPVLEAAPRPAVDTRQIAERQQLKGELTRLERNVADASAQHERLALAAEQLHLAALGRAQRRSTPSWRIEPALAALPVRQPTSLPVVLLAAGLGVVAGSTTLLCGNAKRTIQRAADLREMLAVPLFGALAEQGAAIAGKRREADRLIRAVLLGSEMVLAVFLLAALVSVCMDRSFAGQVAADPLSGLTDGVRHVLTAISTSSA